MADLFYWIGVAVTTIAVAAALGIALLFAYFRLFHDRFSAIWFRRSKRRLSIASWHSSRLKPKDDNAAYHTWPADDWPINDRPLYLSYRFGREKRLFVLAGILDSRRINSIHGDHP